MNQPSRFDFDEEAEVDPQAILTNKQWLPLSPLPIPIETPLTLKVQFKQVSCGAYHTVAVSVLGEVFACGLSSRGRLGLSDS